MDLLNDLKDRLKFIKKMIESKKEMKGQIYEMSAILILKDEKSFLEEVIKKYEEN